MDVAARQVEDADVPRVADIFARGFPASIRHYCGDRQPHPVAFIDLFYFLSRVERDLFLVARGPGGPVGYVVAATGPGGLVRAALTTPYVPRAVWRLLSGGYRVSWRSVIRLLRDKIAMAVSPAIVAYRGGEILSIAVAPDHRCRGVGRRLLEAALARLQGRGIRRVRLEVRPENTAALQLYGSLGFAVRGKITDSQGPWLIMIREVAGAEGPAAHAGAEGAAGR